MQAGWIPIFDPCVIRLSSTRTPRSLFPRLRFDYPGPFFSDACLGSGELTNIQASFYSRHAPMTFGSANTFKVIMAVTVRKAHRMTSDKGDITHTRLFAPEHDQFCPECNGAYFTNAEMRDLGLPTR